MRSHVTAAFRHQFEVLPIEVRRQARQTYLLWKGNPSHPGVQFKRVHRRQPIYFVRIGVGWRALGLRQEDAIIWFWIGSHAGYDGLLKRL